MAFPFVVNGLAKGCSENRKNDALLAGSFGNAGRYSSLRLVPYDYENSSTNNERSNQIDALPRDEITHRAENPVLNSGVWKASQATLWQLAQRLPGCWPGCSGYELSRLLLRQV